MTKAATKKQKKPPVTKDEKDAIRARKLVGHDFAVVKDAYGRDREFKGADRRQFDIGGLKNIVRVRNVDPLQGISKLSWQQRAAGRKYREDYEIVAREGVKTGSWEIRVDGGGGDRERPERISDAHRSLTRASEAMGYGEIRRTVENVCGLGMSISAIATQERNPRDVVSKLLCMGLERLAVHYGIVSHAK